MTITRELAEHIARTRFKDIPHAAIVAARESFADTLAVAWAGSNALGVSAARKLALQEGGSAQSSLWCCASKCPAVNATWINSLCAAALDYDALHPAALVHPGIITVPAALAVGEQLHASGEELLAALAIADDLMCKMGLAHTSNRGWYLTVLYGGVAAAVVSAKLLRLDASGIANAIGLSLASAGGTQQAMVERSTAKRMQVASAAASGVRAAQLAAEGVSGLSAGFEGEFGLYAMFEAGDSSRLTDQLGERYENISVCQKQYPCCGCSHAAIDGLLDILQTQNLCADNVQKVEAIISPYMQRLVGSAFTADGDTEVIAQFSLEYALACVLIYGKFSLEQLRAESVRSPQISAAVQRVKLTVDSQNRGAVAPAVVRVLMHDGKVYEARVDHLKGSAQRPCTADEVDSKLLDCLAHGERPLSAAVAVKILAHIRSAKNMHDVGDFLPLLQSMIGSPTMTTAAHP